jgi:hypothetical protein
LRLQVRDINRRTEPARADCIGFGLKRSNCIFDLRYAHLNGMRILSIIKKRIFAHLIPLKTKTLLTSYSVTSRAIAISRSRAEELLFTRKTTLAMTLMPFASLFVHLAQRFDSLTGKRHVIGMAVVRAPTYLHPPVTHRKL